MSYRGLEIHHDFDPHAHTLGPTTEHPERKKENTMQALVEVHEFPFPKSHAI
jgi:hypothetical protein